MVANYDNQLKGHAMTPMEEVKIRSAFVKGEKVFHLKEKKIATVLAVYGADDDVKLDLTGNTSIAEIERYSPEKHSNYDHTYREILPKWKEEYGIDRVFSLREDFLNRHSHPNEVSRTLDEGMLRRFDAAGLGEHPKLFAFLKSALQDAPGFKQRKGVAYGLLESVESWLLENPNRKYVVGKLCEVNGGREYAHLVKFTTSLDGDPDEILDQIAASFLEDEEGESLDVDAIAGGYSVDGGRYFIRPEWSREINASEFGFLDGIVGDAGHVLKAADDAHDADLTPVVR